MARRDGGAREGIEGRNVVVVATMLAVILALAGCLPIPDVRFDLSVDTPRYRVPLDRVLTSFEAVPGARAPGTPEDLNRSYVLRYHLRDDPETIVVLVPGLFGGATSFEPLARQIVAAIPGTEVWAVDRRANALEDRSGLQQAIRARDPGIALQYYVERRGQPGGFEPLTQDEVGFMAGWGLDVHLEDLDAVVERAGQRADRVVLGGHSLGATLASLYASYRRVHHGEAGQDVLDGLLLIDGTLGRTGAFRIGDVLEGPLGSRFLPSAADVRERRFPPFLTTFVSPGYFVERAVVAQLAWYRPNDPAPEALAEHPMTNLALAGSMFDEETHVLPIFAASVGHAVGAEYHGNLPAFLLTGRHGAGSRSIAGVAPGEERIGWARGDPAVEVTDLRGLLRAWTHPEADHNEWYFPLALALETAEMDARLQDRRDFRPTADITIPTVAFGAEKGLVSDLDGFSSYLNLRYGSPIAAYVLPGFTHIDVVSAEGNPLVGILARWLEGLPAEPGPT